MAFLGDIFSKLPDMGVDAMLEVMARIIDALGQGTEFTGDQIAKLGELEQQLAALARMAKGE
jgi:hypothetical protein